ncbi:Proline-rich receptor-like protein kinase PERK1 [Escovopsis weberi]|uniref:Proline-rich receptor-like protein kinase PERK1 n=1 Tax=Escovopsis weberi TaxID=150374 RepID=A0A0M8N680_ESCWE|nr:Proline-rich receptor-like protein kinase PERK1 [Escovopsis weberi]
MGTQSRSPQDKNACPDGKAYFACGSSSFRGCCSKDPCALGFCPDKLNFNRDPRDPADEEPTETTLFPPPTSKSQDKKSQETPIETMTDDKSKPALETPPPLPPTNSMTTMTDSGITHTIPNNSVVTVILHTTITTKRPSSAASSTDYALSTGASLGTSIDMNGATATGPASPAETGEGASSDAAAEGLSTAAIIGVAVGGVVLISILGMIAMFVRRRRRERNDDASEVYSPGFNEENGAVRREEMPEEKHYPPPVSTHTTGTQGSGDPFAPFGEVSVLTRP